jgi:hypothetical protein
MNTRRLGEDSGDMYGSVVKGFSVVDSPLYFSFLRPLENRRPRTDGNERLQGSPRHPWRCRKSRNGPSRTLVLYLISTTDHAGMLYGRTRLEVFVFER